MEISVSRGVTNEGVPFYTCNTCGLSFPTADLQRLHMKTDWHRYNLKRRVASLPPISSEVFAEKILQQQAQEAEEAAAQQNGGRAKRGTGVRQVTKKDKKREERLQRRLASNQAAEEASEKKRATATAAGIDRPASPSGDSVISSSFSLGEPVRSDNSSISDNHSEIDSQSEANFTELDSETASRADDASTIDGTDNEDEIDRELKRRLARNRAIPPNCCFITDKEFESVEANAEHLWKSYGLFIPERNYLTDLTGLMTYLGEKVGLGNMCLYCGFEGRSLESIRAHMLAKSHVKIPYESIEDKLEISEYTISRPLTSLVPDARPPLRPLLRMMKTNGKTKTRTEMLSKRRTLPARTRKTMRKTTTKMKHTLTVPVWSLQSATCALVTDQWPATTARSSAPRTSARARAPCWPSATTGPVVALSVLATWSRNVLKSVLGRTSRRPTTFSADARARISTTKSTTETSFCSSLFLFFAGFVSGASYLINTSLFFSFFFFFFYYL